MPVRISGRIATKTPVNGRITILFHDCNELTIHNSEQPFLEKTAVAMSSIILGRSVMLYGLTVLEGNGPMYNTTQICMNSVNLRNESEVVNCKDDKWINSRKQLCAPEQREVKQNKETGKSKTQNVSTGLYKI